MVKWTIKILLLVLMLQQSDLIYGMEGGDSFLNGVNRDCSIDLSEYINDGDDIRGDSLRYSLSLTTSEIEAGLVQQVIHQCRQRYLSGQELGRLMLEGDHFRLGNAVAYINHGADVDYALKLVLERHEENIRAGKIEASLEDWVRFLLARGAQFPNGYLDLVLKVLGSKETQEQNMATFLENDFEELRNLTKDGSQLFTLTQKVRELFLLAAGQDARRVLIRIFIEFRGLIPTELVQEGFINAAYANHTVILETLLIHGAQLEDIFTDALEAAAIRRNRSTINFIIQRYNETFANFAAEAPSQLIQQQHQLICNLKFSTVIAHIRMLSELEGIPHDEIFEEYQEILNQLEDALKSNSEESFMVTPVPTTPQSDNIRLPKSKSEIKPEKPKGKKPNHLIVSVPSRREGMAIQVTLPESATSSQQPPKRRSRAKTDSAQDRPRPDVRDHIVRRGENALTRRLSFLHKWKKQQDVKKKN